MNWSSSVNTVSLRRDERWIRRGAYGCWSSCCPWRWRGGRGGPGGKRGRGPAGQQGGGRDGRGADARLAPVQGPPPVERAAREAEAQTGPARRLRDRLLR